MDLVAVGEVAIVHDLAVDSRVVGGVEVDHDPGVVAPLDAGVLPRDEGLVDEDGRVLPAHHHHLPIEGELDTLPVRALPDETGGGGRAHRAARRDASGATAGPSLSMSVAPGAAAAAR
jgi:hypothetical protein